MRPARHRSTACALATLALALTAADRADALGVENAFTTAVAAIEQAVGIRHRPGRDLGCFRPGVCRAHLGGVSLRSVGNAAGTRLTVTSAPATGAIAPAPGAVLPACAAALAAIAHLEGDDARHILAAAAQKPTAVDGISVTRTAASAGMVCRLHVPANANALAPAPQ